MEDWNAIGEDSMAELANICAEPVIGGGSFSIPAFVLKVGQLL